jgi:hypothetical protein
MILSILFAVLLGVHPLHVSVTEITWDEKEKELEIISRIFIDDLETAVRASNKQPGLDLMNPGNTSTTDKLVQDYLQSRFKIVLDGKVQPVHYLGHEQENEALLCYIQVKNVKKWKSIEVMNTVITETYDDQSNLVHVTVRDETKSLRLMRDNPSGKLSFTIK